MTARVYHWKHGWIPLTRAAALSKAKGDHKLAARLMDHGHDHGHDHGPGTGLEFTHHESDRWAMTEAQKREIAGHVHAVKANVPHMGDVRVSHTESHEVGAFGTAHGFQVGPGLFDKETADNYLRDWRGGVSLAGSAKDHGELRKIIVTHEMGHTLMHRIERHSDAGHREIHAFLDEQVTPRTLGFTAGANVDKPMPRWQVDNLGGRSAYANESRYEFWAEALTDGLTNGENATESGKRAVEMARRYLG